MSTLIKLEHYHGYVKPNGGFVYLNVEELDNFFKERKKLEKEIIEETDANKKAELERQRVKYVHEVNIILTDQVLKMSAKAFMHQLMVLHPTLDRVKWTIDNIIVNSYGAEVEVTETRFDKGDEIPAEWGYKEGELFNEDFVQKTITKFESERFKLELQNDMEEVYKLDRLERRKRLGLIVEEKVESAE